MTKKRPDLTGLSIGISTDAPAIPTGLIAQLDSAPAPETVPTADVSPHPDNPRSSFGDLSGLVATIERDGLIQPIVVIPAQQWNIAHPDRAVTGKWLVIAGHRRLEASREAGRATIRISVRPDLAGDQATLTAMFVENTHRENLAPMDEALVLGRFRDTYGLSQVQISRATGISQGQVSKRLALLGLPEPLQEMVNDGALPSNLAHRFLQLPVDEQTDTIDELTRFSLPAEEAIGRAEQRATKTAARQAVVDGLVARGVRVIADPTADLGENYRDHELRDPDLIEAAISHGSAAASVALAGGAVVWYRTSPGPDWPRAAEDEASTESPVDSTFDAGEPELEHAEAPPEDEDLVPLGPSRHRRPKPTQRRPPSTESTRRAIIRKFLASRIRPAQGSSVLLALTLVPSDDVEDPDLVCELEGCGQTRTWTEHVAWVTQMVSSHDTAVRLKAALAVAFARAETIATDQTPWRAMTPGHQLYLEVLATHIGYLRADHELSPRSSPKEPQP